MYFFIYLYINQYYCIFLNTIGDYAKKVLIKHIFFISERSQGGKETS